MGQLDEDAWAALTAHRRNQLVIASDRAKAARYGDLCRTHAAVADTLVEHHGNIGGMVHQRMWRAERTLPLDRSQHLAVAEVPLPWVEHAPLLEKKPLHLCAADTREGRVIRHIRPGDEQIALDLAVLARRLDPQDAAWRNDLRQRHTSCDQIAVGDKLSEGQSTPGKRLLEEIDAAIAGVPDDDKGRGHYSPTAT